LIVAAVKALTLPGADKGLNYLFRFRQEDFLNYKVWLEALSQSAWSTGAGWGLILTYATYTGRNENVFVNSTLTGIGDNLASILIGLSVIPAVFALSASPSAANEALQAGNQGLTFIYIPQLFDKMSLGIIFTALFFLVLFMASITSLISMQELAVRIVMDYGYKRGKAVVGVGTVALIAGFPSAYSLKFFNNQDWVWGVGLLLSGFFFITFILRYGIENFKRDILEYSGKHFLLRTEVLTILFYFISVEFVVMFLWWILQSVRWYPQNWWNPLEEFSFGSCLLQWGIIVCIGLLFNKKLSVAGKSV
jgi:NSS family neurotransmitter:Na+ symporter